MSVWDQGQHVCVGPDGVDVTCVCAFIVMHCNMFETAAVCMCGVRYNNGDGFVWDSLHTKAGREICDRAVYTPCVYTEHTT